MKEYSTLMVNIEKHFAEIVLNRPEVKNAFNDVMISELADAYSELGNNKNIKGIVLRGSGNVFCAGADLNWMRETAEYSFEENYEDSLKLSELLHTIYECPKITIVIVHGAAMGGANGLIAASDIVYAIEPTVFSLSEVRIGLIPACISPYVIKRIGEMKSKELMLTGDRIDADFALRIGLINKKINSDQLEEALSNLKKMISNSGPEALMKCKNLIIQISNNITINESLEYTAKMIAEIRASDEGKEGISAFLEKRKPKWLEDQND